MSTEEVVAELGAVLDGLLRPEAEPRQNAETFLRQRTASLPGEVLLALAQIGALAVGGYQVDQRFLALVLLRRIAFRDLPGLFLNEQARNATSPFDYIAERSRAKVEQMIVAGLRAEQDSRIRKGLGTCAATWAAESSKRQRPCLSFPPLLLELATSDQPIFRFTTYQVLDACPTLLVDSVRDPLSTDQICHLLTAGLHDPSFDVAIEAIKAVRSVVAQAFTVGEIEQYGSSLVAESFTAVARLPSSLVSHGLLPLVEMAEQYPQIFMAHRGSIFPFLLRYLAPPTSCVPLYENYRFSNDQSYVDVYEDWTEISRPSVEILLAMLENWPAETIAWERGRVLQGLVGWVMADFVASQADDMRNEEWLETVPVEYEQNSPAGEVMKRVMDATPTRDIIKPVWSTVEALVSKSDWRCRDAALNAVFYAAEHLDAATQEGSEQGSRQATDADFLRPIMGLGRDENARVRWTWLVAVGEMSRWFEGSLQRNHHAQIVPMILNLVQDPVSRVRAQSLVCLDLFFSDDSAPTLWDAYRDAVIDRMLVIFPEGPIYVSEQIMRTYTQSGLDLVKGHPPTAGKFFDLCLQVTRNCTGKQERNLAGLACAAGAAMINVVTVKEFGLQAVQLVAEMLKLQDSITEADDPRSRQVLSAGADFCRALRRDFVPFLPRVLPPLLRAAGHRARPQPRRPAGLSEDGPDADDDESLAANTSEMEDKTVALGALAEYATSLRGDFAPFVAQIMPIALDALSVRESYEVREAAPLLIVSLLQCAKEASDFSSIDLDGLFGTLLHAAKKTEWYTETALVMKAFRDSLRIIEIALPQSIVLALFGTVNALLDDLYDARDSRAARASWMDEVNYAAEIQTQEEEQLAVKAIAECVQQAIQGCQATAGPTSIDMVQGAGILERLRRIDVMRINPTRHGSGR